VVGHWLPTATDIPIHIDDVMVRPGDWLHGDRDGMVRIPAERAREVAEKAVAAMNTESLVRRAILDGVDPQEAYLRHRKF
jgi:regulator of RNase E activity RraA